VRTLLICHEEEPLNAVALARWMASFSELAGIVVIQEKGSRFGARLRAEIRRNGYFRLWDVFAFRLRYRLRGQAARDHGEEQALVDKIRAQYPDFPPSTRLLLCQSPNSPEAQQFIADCAPDVMIARCKRILAKRIFSLAKTGTFVLHPGICPEYRNAHGCFWAMSEGDAGKVGLTLLQVDEGVDTGPVYGYYSVPYDPLAESHIHIQNRVVFENLDAIRDKLVEIHQGTAPRISTAGRKSAVWGQPWLSRQLAIERRARAARHQAITLLYHDVVPGEDRSVSGFAGADADLYKHTAAEFAGHIAAIAAKCRRPVMLMQDLSGRQLLQPPLLLTFDDGGSGALLAAQVIEAQGWRGHFFITTDRIGTPGFLSADDIRGLDRRGHVIGSHSATHPSLMATLSPAAILEEWRQSVRALTEILGRPVNAASVPTGSFSRQVAAAAAQASIRYLFTSEPTPEIRTVDGVRIFGRYCAKQSTPPDRVVDWVNGGFWSRAGERVFWEVKKILKAAGGAHWLDFRKWFLSRRQAEPRG